MNGLLSIFANNLLPILLVAAAGYALQRSLQLDGRALGVATFYIFSPALVFKLLTETPIDPADLLRMTGFAAFVIAGVALLSLALARGLRLSPRMTAAFVLASAFMNTGNYGLSLNLLAFGDQGLAWASLFYITSSILLFTLGIWIVNVGRTSGLGAIARLAKVPVVYAAPLALLARSTGAVLPAPILKTVDLLAAAAVPALLVLLGMQIARAHRPGQLGLLAACVGLRLLLSPLLAWFMTPLFHLSSLARSVAVTQAAMPTAMMTAVIALEYDAQAEFVANAILASTILSPLTVTPLLLLLGA